MVRINLLFFLSILILPQVLLSQQGSELSKNIITIQGKQYIIHIVKKSETLYGISRQYNIPYDTILRHNPFLVPSSLEVGETIKIPVSVAIPDQQPKITENIRYHEVVQGETLYRIAIKHGLKVDDLLALNPETAQGIYPGQKIRLPGDTEPPVELQADGQFIYHTVQSGESLEQIAQKYGAKVKDISKANNNFKSNQLYVGMLLKIPHKITVTSEIPEQSDGEWHYHKVQPKETLYSLSKKYNLSVDDIKKYNPALKERELLAGEVLKLPVSIVSTIAQEHSELTTPTAEAVLPKQSKVCPCHPRPQKEYKIGLLLPFFTNFIPDSVDNFQIPARSRQFIEFYQGALIAIRDLQRKGLNAELYVFDTQNSTYKTQTICESNEFKQLDLIIGPVFGRNLEIVSKAANELKIPIVSPLSTDESFLQNNSRAFMVTPTQKTMEERIVSAILALNQSNYIVILDAQQQDSLFVPTLKRRLYSKYSSKDIHQLRYTEFNYFKGQETKLLELFEAIDTAVVVIPSSDEAFVSDIVGRLNTLSNQKRITLIGQPRWMRFENVKLEFLHNLNAHLFSISNPDYSKVSVVNFIKDYRNYFGTEPTSRSFEGYDITLYFLEALYKYGKNFPCCLPEHASELLHLALRFRPIDENSGFTNEKVYMVKYRPNWIREFIPLN